MEPILSDADNPPDARPPGMGQIQHVVVLMLENRSLDSLLGWLYETDQPLNHIPPLRTGERAYEGLQNLDLTKYINSSIGNGDINLEYKDTDLRYEIDLTLRGVLIAGNEIGAKWAATSIINADDGKRRAALIEQLVAHSNQSAPFFEGQRDDELIGMAGAILYLLGHGNRDRNWLRTRSPKDHRNTVIVVLTDVEIKRRAHGQPPRFEGQDQGKITKWLQSHRDTKALVELATKDQAWLRLHIAPIRGANASNSPNFSPGESFLEVNCQHYGTELVPDERSKQPPTMKGFVRDYVRVLKHDRGCTDAQVLRYADQVMRSYTPEQLPVLNGLAKHYAVCDMWFSSLPSQTNGNRAFAFCGTSNGLVDNGFLEEDKRAGPIEELVHYKLGDDRFHAKTIFNALADSGISWEIFYRCGLLQDNIAKAIDAYRGVSAGAGAVGMAFLANPWTRPAGLLIEVADAVAAIYLLKNHVDLDYLYSLCDSSVGSVYSNRLFPELDHVAEKDSHFKTFEEFDKAAQAGTLPSFTFIEPVWSISPQSTGSRIGQLNFLYHLGDDYHPPCNLDGAENLVKSIYSSLISNESAWRKTLFIITFDEPVGAFDHVPPPAAVPPWGDKAPPVKCEKEFRFNRYGGRVPTLLISPLIEKGTVFRSPTDTPYDHTSLIATILKWRELEAKIPDFGERTRHAPTFEHVLTRTQPRRDAAEVGFLKDGHRIGDTVRYHDRFCLQSEDGRYISAFKEAAPGWGFISVLFGSDGALTEFYPTLRSEEAKKAHFYFVNAEDRADASRIMRFTSADADKRQPVKLVSLDTGLGSYTVLGKWQDSLDCYYSNDYIEGALDDQERWLISKADRDEETGADRFLRYGQWITIENKRWPKHFLGADGEWVRTSGTRAMWKVLPVGSLAPVWNLGVQFQVHMQNVGWMAPQPNSAMAGLPGQGLRMEAVNISLQRPAGSRGDVGIGYEAHVENVGWQGARYNGGTAGTVGRSLRVEAIRIWLVNPPEGQRVAYKVYIQDVGWGPLTYDGGVAGTTGQSKRIEGIEIRLIP